MSQVSKCCGAKVLIQGANSTTCGICLQPCDVIEEPVSLSEKKRVEAMTKKNPSCSCSVKRDNPEQCKDCGDVRMATVTPKPTEAGEFVKDCRATLRARKFSGGTVSLDSKLKEALDIIESQERQIKGQQKIIDDYNDIINDQDECYNDIKKMKVLIKIKNKHIKFMESQVKKLTEENEHLRQSVKE